MPTTEKAPGLIWRRRSNGSQVAYWSARPDLVKAGYRPKTVRLHYAPDDPALAARCRVLQTEMLAWSVSNRQGPATLYDGTFASLIRFYESHPDSPFHELRPNTRRVYSTTMVSLMKHKGERLIKAVDGSDVRRWYKELVESNSKGWAYYTINVLKAALSFGATKRITECQLLRAELREAKFGVPGGRKERLTYEQVVAFRAAANELGFPWMGLCLTLQFDLGFRRRDVIGEYVMDEVATDGIRDRKFVWRDGLTTAHIDEHGVLRKLVSKTAFTSEMVAVHAIADYPDVEAELAKLPPDRIGPLVINDMTGLPPNEAQCRRYFRVIARKAGIPDTVQQMDARAGANTEAFAAGATEDERMAMLTHSEPSTNRGYIRDLTEPSRRAAAKRIELRKK